MNALESAERYSWKVGRSSLSMHRVHGGEYDVGHVTTAHGIVSVFQMRGCNKVKDVTALTFVCGGRAHNARWERLFTDRFLVTLATRFAAEALASTPNTEADHG